MSSVSELRKLCSRLLIPRLRARRFSNDVILDISTACVASCVYCLHQRHKLVKPQLMTSTTFMAIADILAREKFELVYLYMAGEPFLHPDLPEFIAAIAERNMDSSTATKLSVPVDFERLDRALSQCDLTDHKVEFLITIDSFGEENQRKIAPGIDKARVLANLTEMAKLRNHRSVKFVFTTVVNRYNEDELDEIRTTLANLGFTVWSPKQMGYYMPYAASQEDIATIAEFLAQDPQYRARFDIEGGKIISRQKHCDLGAPAISIEGDVTICCHDMLHKLCLGNVLQEGSLRNILKSGSFRRAAAAGRKMRLDICKGCN